MKKKKIKYFASKYGIIAGIKIKSCKYRVSKKKWTFFEIGIILLFVEESFQNFVCLQ